MTARRGKRKKDKEPPIPKGQPKVKITDARGDPVHLEMGDLKEVKMLFGSDIKISGEAQEYLGGLANQHFNLEGSWVFSRHSPFPFSHYRGNIIQVTHFLGRELGVPYRDILGGVPIICSSEFMVGARQFEIFSDICHIGYEAIAELRTQIESHRIVLLHTPPFIDGSEYIHRDGPLSIGLKYLRDFDAINFTLQVCGNSTKTQEEIEFEEMYGD